MAEATAAGLPVMAHRRRPTESRTLCEPSTALGWPDGRLLSASQLDHLPAWFRLHHIQVWLTYQPGSRFLPFQFIEFSWLIALSAILIGAALVLIRRRAA
jgi:hypothetical protein